MDADGKGTEEGNRPEAGLGGVGRGAILGGTRVPGFPICSPGRRPAGALWARGRAGGALRVQTEDTAQGLSAGVSNLRTSTAKGAPDTQDLSLGSAIAAIPNYLN